MTQRRFVSEVDRRPYQNWSDFSHDLATELYPGWMHDYYTGNASPAPRSATDDISGFLTALYVELSAPLRLTGEMHAPALVGALAALREMQGSSRKDFQEQLQQAAQVLREVADVGIFGGRAARDTDWASFLYSLVKASCVDGVWHPWLVTSVGGSDQEPSLVAASNCLPVFWLSRCLQAAGYRPNVVISSALQYAVLVNGFESAKVRANYEITEELYRAMIDNFFPMAATSAAFEVADPDHLVVDLPVSYIQLAEEVLANPLAFGNRIAAVQESLLRTAAKFHGDDGVGPLPYLLSHQQVFRDVQTGSRAYMPFVIKVGAPSEGRFSAYERTLTEIFIAKQPIGSPILVPNRVQRHDNAWRYGQISMLYPRLGSRPPYYLEQETELTVSAPAANMEVAFASYPALEGDLGQRFRGARGMLDDMGIGYNAYCDVIAALSRGSR